MRFPLDQPVGDIKIDWNNPITRNLNFAWLATVPTLNLANLDWGKGSTATIAIGSSVRGLAARSGVAGHVKWTSKPSIWDTTAFTVFSVGCPPTTALDGVGVLTCGIDFTSGKVIHNSSNNSPNYWQLTISPSGSTFGLNNINPPPKHPVPFFLTMNDGITNGSGVHVPTLKQSNIGTLSWAPITGNRTIGVHYASSSAHGAEASSSTGGFHNLVLNWNRALTYGEREVLAYNPYILFKRVGSHKPIFADMGAGSYTPISVAA